MNNKFPVIVFMVIMLMTLAATVGAKELDFFTVPLQKCSKVLDSVDKAFQSLNVSTLPVQYRYGILIEKTRTRALKYVVMARKNVDRLRKQPTVSSMLLLVTHLRELETNIENMNTLLLETITNAGNQRENVAKWLDTFSEVSTKLSEAVNDYEDAAYNFAESIDDKLDRCK